MKAKFMNVLSADLRQQGLNIWRDTLLVVKVYKFELGLVLKGLILLFLYKSCGLQFLKFSLLFQIAIANWRVTSYSSLGRFYSKGSL